MVAKKEINVAVILVFMMGLAITSKNGCQARDVGSDDDRPH